MPVGMDAGGGLHFWHQSLELQGQVEPTQAVLGLQEGSLENSREWPKTTLEATMTSTRVLCAATAQGPAALLLPVPSASERGLCRLYCTARVHSHMVVGCTGQLGGFSCKHLFFFFFLKKYAMSMLLSRDCVCKKSVTQLPMLNVQQAMMEILLPSESLLKGRQAIRDSQHQADAGPCS